MSYKFLSTAISILCLCVGCASSPPSGPPPLPATKVNLQINSGPAINPDINNNPSPVVLRIYEMKERSNFDNADFFALFDKEQATLAADMVRKQEILIKPGENTSLQIEPSEDTRILGFFAAFRKLDNAQWRSTVPLEAHKLNTIQLKINDTNLTTTHEAIAIQQNGDPN